MRRIDRGQAPAKLVSLLVLDPNRSWNSSGEPAVHSAIVESLRLSQEQMCAYCEVALVNGGRVEHVHPKSVVPCAARPSANAHYDWENLLLVCGSRDHCDGPKADKDLCAEVLFPDTMSADNIYFAVDSLTGELRVHEDLSDDEFTRARGALEELHLNAPNLCAARLGVVDFLQAGLQEELSEVLLRHRAQCSHGFATTVAGFFE